MQGQDKTRRNLLKLAIWNRPLMRSLLFLVAGIGFYDTFVSQILPREVAKSWPNIYELVSAMLNISIPWWSWFALIAMAMFLGVLEFVFRSWRKGKKEEKIAELQLTPSSGPSPDIRLAVKNLGSDGEFYATCRIIGTGNNVNDLRTGVFNLGWKSNKNRTFNIAKNEAQELILARWVNTGNEEWKQFDILEWQSSGPQTFEGAVVIANGGNKPLPEFDLEISVFKKNTDEPKVAKYTLRPVSKYGPPLELTPILNEGPNMRLADVVALIIGGRNFFQNKKKTAEALILLRKKARLGNLAVWGKTNHPDSPLGKNEPLNSIPKDDWKAFQFDFMDFLNDPRGKSEKAEPNARGQIYREFWFNRDEAEKEISNVTR